MTNEKEKVLVAGANGTTGKIIIDLLQANNNYKPLAMVRKLEQKENFEAKNVETVLADLEEELGHSVKNIDKVIFAAGSKGKNLIGVDQEGAKRLADAAKKEGVKKFVMLSSISADNPEASDELEDYLKAKQNADNYLRETGLNYSIVRPGRLTNDEPTGKVKVQEKLDSPGKITRADVAKALVEVLKDGVKHNSTFELIEGEVKLEEALQN